MTRKVSGEFSKSGINRGELLEYIEYIELHLTSDLETSPMHDYPRIISRRGKLSDFPVTCPCCGAHQTQARHIGQPDHEVVYACHGSYLRDPDCDRDPTEVGRWWSSVFYGECGR